MNDIVAKVKTRDQIWMCLCYLLIAFIFVLICFTFRDYGIQWDEEIHKDYGNAILQWYGSFFQNPAPLVLHNLYLYGGLFETIAQFVSNLVVLITSSNLFETRHFINALFGLLGIIGAYKLGSLIDGRMGGFFSAFFLSLTPRFYGDMFNNSKDIPFAALFLLSLYYIILSYQYLPRLPNSLIIKLGILIGLTLGVRIGGVILYGYLGVLVVGWLISQYVVNHDKLIIIKETTQSLLSLFFVLIISWVTMIFWWPWAQVSPILHPLKALFTITKFPWEGTVFFKGEFIKATNVPWDYLPTWFSITLPEFYFIAILIGCFLGVSFLLQFQKSFLYFKKFIQIGILLFSIFFPLMVVIILQSTLCDGLRHFLFVIPCLTVLCGISFAKFIRSRTGVLIKQVLSGLIFLSIGLTIFDMIDLHPYQIVYFNRLMAGGLPKASLKFETDYWGNSYKEGAEWLLKHYQNDFQREILVDVCEFPWGIVNYYFNKNKYIEKELTLAKIKYRLRISKEKSTPSLKEFDNHKNQFLAGYFENSDLSLAFTRWNCHKKKKGKILHVVSRKETPLLYVIELISPGETH